MRTLAQIISDAIKTGKPQTMTQEEQNHFHARFAAAVGPEIDRIRADQKRAYAECRNLMLD